MTTLTVLLTVWLANVALIPLLLVSDLWYNSWVCRKTDTPDWAGAWQTAKYKCTSSADQWKTFLYFDIMLGLVLVWAVYGLVEILWPLMGVELIWMLLLIAVVLSPRFILDYLRVLEMKDGKSRKIMQLECDIRKLELALVIAGIPSGKRSQKVLTHSGFIMTGRPAGSFITERPEDPFNVAGVGEDCYSVDNEKPDFKTMQSYVALSPEHWTSIEVV